MHGEKTGRCESKREFSDLVERVQYQGDTYIISRHGEPTVAFVPIEVHESWKRERRAFFDLFRQTQQQASLTSEEADHLASEAAAAARAET